MATCFPGHPREQDDGPFVSAVHRRDGPTRCLPVELPSFLFNYEQVHLLAPAEPNPSNGIYSSLSKQTWAFKEIFCFCLKGNKVNGSNDYSRSKSQGQS